MKARKIIIPVSIIAGIAAIGAAVAALSSSASSVSYAETSEIQLKTLENTISVGGLLCADQNGVFPVLVIFQSFGVALFRFGKIVVGVYSAVFDGSLLLKYTSSLEEFQEAYAAAKQEYETIKNKYDKENLKKQIETAENQLESLIEGLEAARDSAG